MLSSWLFSLRLLAVLTLSLQLLASESEPGSIKQGEVF